MPQTARSIYICIIIIIMIIRWWQLWQWLWRQWWWWCYCMVLWSIYMYLHTYIIFLSFANINEFFFLNSKIFWILHLFDFSQLWMYFSEFFSGFKLTTWIWVILLSALVFKRCWLTFRFAKESSLCYFYCCYLLNQSWQVKFNLYLNWLV